MRSARKYSPISNDDLRCEPGDDPDVNGREDAGDDVTHTRVRYLSDQKLTDGAARSTLKNRKTAQNERVVRQANRCDVNMPDVSVNELSTSPARRSGVASASPPSHGTTSSV